MRKDSKKYRKNHEIRASLVRLIGDDGKIVGDVSIGDAMAKADGLGMDVVEINPSSTPPICRLVDYGKFLYEQSKRTSSKPSRTEPKEIQFHPRISPHDVEIKANKIRRLLTKGDRVRAVMLFRGREEQYQQLGMDVLKNVVELVGDVANIEVVPTIKGNSIFVVLISK